MDKKDWEWVFREGKQSLREAKVQIVVDLKNTAKGARNLGADGLDWVKSVERKYTLALQILGILPYVLMAISYWTRSFWFLSGSFAAFLLLGNNKVMKRIISLSGLDLALQYFEKRKKIFGIEYLKAYLVFTVMCFLAVESYMLYEVHSSIEVQSSIGKWPKGLEFYGVFLIVGLLFLLSLFMGWVIGWRILGVAVLLGGTGLVVLGGSALFQGTSGGLKNPYKEIPIGHYECFDVDEKGFDTSWKAFGYWNIQSDHECFQYLYAPPDDWRFISKDSVPWSLTDTSKKETAIWRVRSDTDNQSCYKTIRVCLMRKG